MESEAFQMLLQQPKQQGEGPISPSETTATSLVFDMRCVKTLQQDVGGHWFHLNEEM